MSVGIDRTKRSIVANFVELESNNEYTLKILLIWAWYCTANFNIDFSSTQSQFGPHPPSRRLVLGRMHQQKLEEFFHLNKQIKTDKGVDIFDYIINFAKLEYIVNYNLFLDLMGVPWLKREDLVASIPKDIWEKLVDPNHTEFIDIGIHNGLMRYIVEYLPKEIRDQSGIVLSGEKLDLES